MEDELDESIFGENKNPYIEEKLEI